MEKIGIFFNSIFYSQSTPVIRKIARLIGHTEKVIGVLQLKSGDFVSYSSDSVILIWDINTSQIVAALKEHTKFISKVLEYENDKLVSCSGDLTIKVWSTKTYMCLGTLSGHSNIINEMIIINYKFLASKSINHVVNIWDITSFTCKKTFTNAYHTAFQVSNKEFNMYYVSDKEKILNIIQLNDQGTDFTHQIQPYDNDVMKLIALKTGKLVVINNSRTSIVSTSSNKISSKQITEKGNNYLLTELSSGNLAVITGKNKIGIINASTAQCHSVVNLNKSQNSLVRVFELKDRSLVSHSNSEIYIIDPITFRCKTIGWEHSKAITTVCELSTGFLGSCSWDNTMKIWSILTLRKVATVSIAMNWIPFNVSEERFTVFPKKNQMLLKYTIINLKECKNY